MSNLKTRVQCRYNEKPVAKFLAVVNASQEPQEQSKKLILKHR